ncbi:MAG: glutamate-1-semialdehyde 2,1-aminomutase [bacterium]
MNRELFERAKRIIPGGVNSPVRAFKSVGCDPVFIERAKGSKIYDVEGKEYIDYVGSWGPMILGHADDELLEVLNQTASRGTSFGASTVKETELAELLVECVPSIEMVRLVNSGTEAAMSAIRLARGYTGCDKIIKFEGGYHGHADSLLVKAGSGAATFGVPDSAGVTKGVARDTLTLPYNDLDALEKMLVALGPEIAALIMEPVPGNMGVIVPQEGYLRGVRDLCNRYGVVLIFDEVMSGFRVALGGAQELYGVTPDLTCLGKIIGGGLPVGAYGGKREIMAKVAPDGPVYQAGTLSGNPLAVAAGIVTLNRLRQPGVYERLEERSAQLEAGTRKNLENLGFTINRVGAMICAFFTPGPVTDFASAKQSDIDLFSRYFQHMLKGGINLAPSQFEAGFVSLAHTEEDIENTVKVGARWKI